MRKIFLLLLITVSISKNYGQNKGLVYYGHIESPKMKSANGPEFNAYMVFNNNESYYVYAKDSLDSNTKFKTFYQNEGSDDKYAFGGKLTSKFGRQVYHNRKKDSLYWCQWRGYYVAEKTPGINWQLKKDTKKIGAFTAYKATGKFRGRMYTAWYVLEVPLPYGPWKLQGLPGLIVEAYDEYNEMYLYFKSLEFPTSNRTPITQVKRPNEHPKGWNSLEDFKTKTLEFIERWNNNNYIMSEEYNESPIQMQPKELYIESF